MASNNPAGWIRRIGCDTAVGRLDDPGLLRIGQVRPHRHRRPSGIADLVRSQDFERIFVPAFDQGSNLIQLNASSHNHVLQNCLPSPSILSWLVEFV